MPNCQIFFRNLSGVNATVRPMKPRLYGEGRRGQKAIPFQALPEAMLPNVATLPITVGVGAFLIRERELLVVRKTYGPSRGQWTIPSGYVERHESIVQSVEREVKEETNIVGRAGPMLAVRNRVTETANDTVLVFRLAYLSGRPEPKGAHAYLLYL